MLVTSDTIYLVYFACPFSLERPGRFILTEGLQGDLCIGCNFNMYMKFKRASHVSAIHNLTLL